MLFSNRNGIIFKYVFLLNIVHVVLACTVTIYKDSTDCRGYSQTFTGIPNSSECSACCKIRDLFNISEEHECNTCKAIGDSSVWTKC
ncbi:hypothetical protein BGW37DRAFT_503291 [Umbelopsis sp. PMI_123]|nr:hypothetical protein BGW37DRAFT_503291 [Umbelopsis sp. PMI_123]